MLNVMKQDEPVVYPFSLFPSQEMSLTDTELFQTRIGVHPSSVWISNNGLKLSKQVILYMDSKSIFKALFRIT